MLIWEKKKSINCYLRRFLNEKQHKKKTTKVFLGVLSDKILNFLLNSHRLQLIQCMQYTLCKKKETAAFQQNENRYNYLKKWLRISQFCRMCDTSFLFARKYTKIYKIYLYTLNRELFLDSIYVFCSAFLYAIEYFCVFCISSKQDITGQNREKLSLGCIISAIIKRIFLGNDAVLL